MCGGGSLSFVMNGSGSLVSSRQFLIGLSFLFLREYILKNIETKIEQQVVQQIKIILILCQYLVTTKKVYLLRLLIIITN